VAQLREQADVELRATSAEGLGAALRDFDVLWFRPRASH